MGLPNEASGDSWKSYDTAPGDATMMIAEYALPDVGAPTTPTTGAGGGPQLLNLPVAVGLVHLPPRAVTLHEACPSGIVTSRNVLIVVVSTWVTPFTMTTT